MQKNSCQGNAGLQFPEKCFFAAGDGHGFFGRGQGLRQFTAPGQGFGQQGQEGGFRLQAELVLSGLGQGVFE